MSLEQTAKDLSKSSGEAIKQLMIEQARQTFRKSPFPIMQVALPHNDGNGVYHYKETSKKKGIIVVERKGKGTFGGNEYIVLTPKGLIKINHSRYCQYADDELPSWEKHLIKDLKPEEYHKYIPYVFAALRGSRGLVHLA